MDYNTPAPFLRPIEFEDVPVFEDHIGPSPPHELNRPPRLVQF